MTQMLEFSGKDFKAAIITMLQEEGKKKKREDYSWGEKNRSISKEVRLIIPLCVYLCGVENKIKIKD